ncbi:MAG: PKD domain-containing protein, partial [Flavobacteriales bacterium]|nr:PKD domain-containing protein [Flavobacteriales bacterium]
MFRNFIYVFSLFLALTLGFSTETKASHIMGGEITWECNGSGQYIIHFSVYRDCSGADITPDASGDLVIHNYPNVGQRSWITLDQTLKPTQTGSFLVGNWRNSGNGAGAAIVPDCRGGSNIDCNSGAFRGLAVYEYKRVTQPITLLGTPPAQGWIITYDDNARNATDNLPSTGVSFRAKILPHSGSVAGQCIDNSPKFREKPTSLICLNQNFTYNHNATDDELDSLDYQWAQPLSQVGNNTNNVFVDGVYPTPLVFTNGYSFVNPFPGPESLNRGTGEIILSPNAIGKYVSVIKVTAYKCGEPVAEIYRELQSVISNSCNVSNTKPTFTPPFNGNTSFKDTVRAGDLVTFNITADDFASINLGSIPPYFGDSLTLEASGLQFGTNFTNANSGCINPPCATLTKSLPYKSNWQINETFRWQTDCNHVSFTDQCVSGQNTYTFVITVKDDNCPIPALNIATISITVVGDSVILSPKLNCVNVKTNGDVELDWNTTPNINSSFTAWLIYTSTDRNGPFTLIDTVKNYNTTTYTHVGAGANTQQRFYHVRSLSGCKGVVTNVARDTVGTIFVNPQTAPTVVNVNWTPLNTPNPVGSANQYRVFREYPLGSGLNFYQNTANTTLAENFTPCEDDVRYRVDLVNAAEGCTSSSNISDYHFKFPDPQTKFSFPANPCPAQIINFNNQTTIAGGPMSFLWDFGDLTTSTLTNPTHAYANPGTYTVSLTATSSKGCDSTYTQQITITRPNANAGPNKAICPGGSVTIGGSPTSTTTGVSYAWSPASTLNNPSSPNPLASPNVTTIYTVTVTDGNGCSQTSSMTVTVNPQPTADAGLPQTICNGASTIIGGSPTGTPANSTYLWNNASTLDDATDPNPIASPTITTTYTVTVTSGVNCTATDQVTITVIPAPGANAGADKNICPGSSVQIGGSPTTTSSNASYAWNNAATLTNASLANPVASPTVTTTYTVTVTGTNGCTSTDDVIVNVYPTVTADAGLASYQLCRGNSVVIGGVSTGTAPLTYNWSNGGTLSSTIIQKPTANPTSTTTYRLTVTDANGCSGIDQTTVIVNNLPVANAGADDVICAGESSQLGVATNPLYSYAWDNAGSLNNAAISNPIATPAITTTYTVTVTETSTGCKNTDQVTITVDPLPLVDAGADVTICNTDSAQLGTATTAGYTYLWDNAATLNFNTISNPKAGPSITTTYTVTVTETATGCTATDQVTVSVNALPNLAWTYADTCLGDGTRFTNTTTGSSQYTWDFGDGVGTSNLQNPTYTYANPGTYTVKLIAGDATTSCSDSLSKTIIIKALPIADAGADVTICDRDNITIGTATTAGYTYLWDNGASLSSTIISNPIANPAVTTTYTVTVTETATGCFATDAITITVDPVPVANFSVSDTCVGSSTQFNNTSTGGSSYLWNFGDGTPTSNLQNPTHVYAATGIYTVKLVVSNNNGTTNCKDSISRTIEIKALPVADAGADDVICAGESSQLGVATNPLYSYAWDNAGSLNNAAISNPIATPAITTTYTVTVTETSTGCTNTDQVTITVDPLPLVDAGADVTICNTDSAQLGTATTA